MKYTGKVLIEKEKDSSKRTAESIRRNPHAVSDVNAVAGPRVGNAGTASKRSDFVSAKETRAPLADMIANAFGARAQDDKINPKLEPVSANTRAKFKK